MYESFGDNFHLFKLLTYPSATFVNKSGCMSGFLTIFAARKGRRFMKCLECGEIWLLATTLKNAKIINVLCFCDGSAFLWGLFFALQSPRNPLTDSTFSFHRCVKTRNDKHITN